MPGVRPRHPRFPSRRGKREIRSPLGGGGGGGGRARPGARATCPRPTDTTVGAGLKPAPTVPENSRAGLGGFAAREHYGGGHDSGGSKAEEDQQPGLVAAARGRHAHGSDRQERAGIERL